MFADARRQWGKDIKAFYSRTLVWMPYTLMIKSLFGRPSCSLSSIGTSWTRASSIQQVSSLHIEQSTAFFPFSHRSASAEISRNFSFYATPNCTMWPTSERARIEDMLVITNSHSNYSQHFNCHLFGLVVHKVLYAAHYNNALHAFVVWAALRPKCQIYCNNNVAIAHRDTFVAEHVSWLMENIKN